MNPLTRKIRAKCALDPKREYVNLTDMLATKEENARLQPIIDKLLLCVEALEEISKLPCGDGGMSAGCTDVADKALRSLLEVGE